jgi:hypothetical protein
MKSKRPPELANVPWITAEGTLDCSKFPIDVPIRQCLDPSSEAFGHGCRFLGTMVSAGRVDAGIFLLGLLRYYEDDLTAATIVVESLAAFQDPRCATALFGELRRVASSNKTRRYLDAVITALTRLPADMVQERFSALSRETAFSYKMRAKFRDAAEAIARHW